MSVQRQLLLRSVLFVTLQTGLIATHADFHLIVGPLFFGPTVVCAGVHVVTGKARHGSLLITSRLQQAVVFASAYTNHAVGPELMLPEIWITFEFLFYDRQILVVPESENVSRFHQILSWPKRKSIFLHKIVFVFRIVKVKN